MNVRSTDSEEAAGRAIARVLGGEWELNDTGTEPGQYDIRITTRDGRSVALEVTSYGGDDWKRTRARIASEQEKGKHDGRDLRSQWGVIFPSGEGVRELQAGVEEAISELEARGESILTSDYRGDNPDLQALSQKLRDLRVNEVFVFEEAPPDDQQRILLLQSVRIVGTAGSLTAALTAVFEKGDNQTKLAAAGCDERHLYVFVEDQGAGAVLAGMYPPPACPPDPAGVIDVLWIYSPDASAYLLRVQPGTDDWSRFNMATGAAA